MKQKYSQVGQALPSGVKIIANYNNQFVLANYESAPTPYAVWDLDENGKTINCSSRFYTELESAQEEFAKRFFSQKLLTEDSLMRALDKVIKKYGVPQAIKIDDGKSNNPAEIFARNFAHGLQEMTRHQREETRAEAELTLEYQEAIKHISSCSDLMKITHFWWLEHKKRSCNKEMENTLYLMYRHFLEDCSIL